MDGPEAVHQVRGARAYIILILTLTLKRPFFRQPSNVIFSKRIILLLPGLVLLSHRDVPLPGLPVTDVYHHLVL